MATFVKLPSGTWRAQVRRQQQSVSKSFRLKSDAQRWAMEQESRIERGETATARDTGKTDTVGDLIKLHLDDIAEVGKAAQRSKESALLRLQDDRDVGIIRLADFNREWIIKFGRRRAKEGAGPATLSADLSFIGTVFTHASAVYGHRVPTEDLRLARAALMLLGLVGKSTERDRCESKCNSDPVLGVTGAQN